MAREFRRAVRRDEREQMRTVAAGTVAAAIANAAKPYLKGALRKLAELDEPHTPEEVKDILASAHRTTQVAEGIFQDVLHSTDGHGVRVLPLYDDDDDDDDD